jgi:hypothetical protein
MAIDAKVEKGVLVIRLPINAEPPLSSTGKTRIVASTHGNQATSVVVNGEVVKIGCTAFYRA